MNRLSKNLILLNKNENSDLNDQNIFPSNTVITR